MSDDRARPLDGTRVLDFTRVLSGPHCTRMLSDLGADVIKVEPPAGDATRFANPRVNGLASYFVQQNTGKKNVSLDMAHPEAVGLLLDLAEVCDVVVENFRPGVMARMGLGYEVVAARNPRVVYASISGYGQTGPWVGRRAYAPVVGAETGFTKAQGDARARTGLARRRTATTRTATPTCTRAWSAQLASWRRCSSESAPVVAIASTCRWRRPCCT